MANSYNIPTREDMLIPWFANYSSKLGGYAGTFGLTPAQIASVVADNLALAAALNAHAASKAETKSWGDFKDLELYGPIGGPTPPVPDGIPAVGISPVPPGIIPRARKMANFIKNHPNYTTSIGEDLGFIAPAAAPVPGDAQPTGKATAQGSFQVLLEWVKGKFDGVDIETQREGECGWTYLAFDSFSPYLDTRPPAALGKPEVRRYRMRYRRKEEAVGVWSDVIEVLVGA
jgi:hypothetical protein